MFALAVATMRPACYFRGPDLALKAIWV